MTHVKVKVSSRPPIATLLAEDTISDGARFKISALMNDPQLSVVLEVSKAWYTLSLKELAELLAKLPLTNSSDGVILSLSNARRATRRE